jgi:hypothetical protein
MDGYDGEAFSCYRRYQGNELGRCGFFSRGMFGIFQEIEEDEEEGYQERYMGHVG